MALYGVVFLVCLALLPKIETRLEFQTACLFSLPAFPLLFDFEPSHGPAREALLSRTYFLVSNWARYEWVGVFAPLAICWLGSTSPLRRPSGVSPARYRHLGCSSRPREFCLHPHRTWKT